VAIIHTLSNEVVSDRDRRGLICKGDIFVLLVDAAAFDHRALVERVRRAGGPRIGKESPLSGVLPGVP
jgi:hypothetical protein